MLGHRRIGLTDVIRFLLIAIVCSQAAFAQIDPVLDRDKIRHAFDYWHRKGHDYMVVHTTLPGLVYIAGIERSTGEFKILPARFLKMMEAASNSSKPEEAASKFEAYQFVLRNSPNPTAPQMSLENWAFRLMLSNPEDESDFYETLRTSPPGSLRRAYVKNIRYLVDRFPIEQKGPFTKRAEAAGLDLGNTLILYACYNTANGIDNLDCRSFWYRQPPPAVKSLGSTPVQGDEKVTEYLNNLIYVPTAPWTLKIAEQLIDMGHRGIPIDYQVMLDVFEKFDKAERAQREQEDAELRVTELRERAAALKGHFDCRDSGGTLSGSQCVESGSDSYHPMPGAGCPKLDPNCTEFQILPPRTHDATWVPANPPSLLPACIAALTANLSGNQVIFRKQYCSCIDTGYNGYLSSDEKSVLASDFSPYDSQAAGRDIALFDQQVWTKKGKPDPFTGPGKACSTKLNIQEGGTAGAKN